ncbi:hypothetical protein [Methylobacterium sp. J-092]|uniref:hypothetical protein n=1 Tax=Methylobacterium sp. J-092 TaxID=2836667 RepID=UPI00391D75B7
MAAGKGARNRPARKVGDRQGADALPGERRDCVEHGGGTRGSPGAPTPPVGAPLSTMRTCTAGLCSRRIGSVWSFRDCRAPSQ